ncbi:MAG: ATP-binding protein [Armatimonadetes bacterium]|nr:ATP-binding protein [Armatimonadota bacterium]
MQNETTDWREDAIRAALKANSGEGDGTSAMLRHIRRQRPASARVVLTLDRALASRFLDKEVQTFHSLLPGHDGLYGQDGEFRPLTAWYAVRWEGWELEVVLVPSNGHIGHVIGIADDGPALRRFAEAMSESALHPLGRALRFAGGWKVAPDLDEELGGITWDDIVLPNILMTGIREAVEGFFGNRRTFEALGFAWRRGILLVGPPGTGKTMVCKAAAAALPDLPFLYVRDLNNPRGQEPIRAIFERARQLSPCILAFEDLDGFVNQTNRSLFLNELDGFQNNVGLLIIASSNHPGQIDEALLKRPSRFDRVFHLGLPGPEERRAYCRQVLSRSTLVERLAPTLDVDALAAQVAERTDGFTPAYLKEAFISAALQRVQDGETLLDDLFAVAVLEQVNELHAHLKRMRDPDALSEMQSGAAMGLRR